MKLSIISHSLVALLFLSIGFGIGYANFNTNSSELAAATSNTANTTSDGNITTQPIETESANTTTLSADNLTPEQQALAQSLGIDPNTVTITQEMIVCAETKLGSDRVDAITNGETPSFSEGVTLAGCYTNG